MCWIFCRRSRICIAGSGAPTASADESVATRSAQATHSANRRKWRNETSQGKGLKERGWKPPLNGISSKNQVKTNEQGVWSCTAGLGYAPSQPASPLQATTRQGGHLRRRNRTKAATASPTSKGEWIPFSTTGSMKAAKSRPTTAALIPRSAAAHEGERRTSRQNGAIAAIRRKDGEKIATVATNAPSGPCSGQRIAAPR